MDKQKRKKILRRVNWVLDAAQRVAKTSEARSYIEGIQLCVDGYAEPSYDDPKSGLVALGNWNGITRYDRDTGKFEPIDDTPIRVANLLERLGVELEWEDEWITCSSCNKLVRTQPNSYCWLQSYVEVSGDALCMNCVDPAEYLESLEGEFTKANTIQDIDPSKYDYIRLDQDFEHGMHYGQDASPELIAKALKRRGIQRYLFNIDSRGQFDVDFSAWVHKDEAHLITPLKSAEFNGPSVAGAMERGLREASLKMGELKGDGIKYAQIQPDGTAKVRLVDHEEFVRGIRDE